MLLFMATFSDQIGTRLAIAISAVVLLIEVTIGACLVTGRHLRLALRTAWVLNVLFVAMGVVTPSAFFLVIQLTLLLELSTRRSTATRTMEVLAVANYVDAFALVSYIRPCIPTR